MAAESVFKKAGWILVLCLLAASFLVGCNTFASPPADNGPKEPVETEITPGGKVKVDHGLVDCGVLENDPGTPGDPAPTEDICQEPPSNDVNHDHPLADPDKEPPSPPDPGETRELTRKEPIIYVGQLLKIPGGGTPPSESLVVSKGLPAGGTKQAALTFDSGWLYENTLPLLDILDAYDIKATFFPRALWVFNPGNPNQSYPELAREIVKRGHTMGNHSLTHPDMSKLSLDEVRHEIRESTRLIQETTGVRPFLFRPPYGAYNKAVLKTLSEEGYPYTIMWTVDTHDWAEEIRGQAVTADYIRQRVLDNVCDGAIILMHVGGNKTVEALPRIIEGLMEKGYSFTTVDSMAPSPVVTSEFTCTVRKGDTLYSLAGKYGTTVEELIALNNL